MGRAKLNMELIQKEKARNITYKKRKEGLIRKIHEFTTLCDVDACMIIYGGPQQEKGYSEPEIWPENPDEVKRIIGIYRNKNKDSTNKTYGLHDFFQDRKKKVEEEVAKLRKKNMEAKYPTSLELVNCLTADQLREFAAELGKRSEYVKSRLEMMKRSKEKMEMNKIDFSHSRMNQSHQPLHFNNNPGLIQRGIELEFMNQPSMKPNLEMHVPMYPNLDHSVNHNNSMMRLLMNENEDVQFGSGPSGGNISFKRQVYYEAATGGQGMVAQRQVELVDNKMCHMTPRPLARYYAVAPPPLPPVPPQYVQYAMMSGMVLPPQLPGSSRDQNDGMEDFLHYQMKNQR